MDIQPISANAMWIVLDKEELGTTFSFLSGRLEGQPTNSLKYFEYVDEQLC